MTDAVPPRYKPLCHSRAPLPAAPEPDYLSSPDFRAGLEQLADRLLSRGRGRDGIPSLVLTCDDGRKVVVTLEAHYKPGRIAP